MKKSKLKINLSKSPDLEPQEGDSIALLLNIIAHSLLKVMQGEAKFQHILLLLTGPIPIETNDKNEKQNEF